MFPPQKFIGWIFELQKWQMVAKLASPQALPSSNGDEMVKKMMDNKTLAWSLDLLAKSPKFFQKYPLSHSRTALNVWCVYAWVAWFGC